MLDINVKNLIPHREPILLVDTVEDFVKDDFVITTKHVKNDDPIFEGHFPGHPVWPGVYTVEALAQTSACLVNLSLEKTAEETIFYFMAMDSVKFRAPVLPDTKLDLHIRMVKKRGTVFRFEGEASVDGKVVTEAAFTAKVELLDK